MNQILCRIYTGLRNTSSFISAIFEWHHSLNNFVIISNQLNWPERVTGSVVLIKSNLGRLRFQLRAGTRREKTTDCCRARRRTTQIADIVGRAGRVLGTRRPMRNVTLIKRIILTLHGRPGGRERYSSYRSCQLVRLTYTKM
jgi:hypothetical protein